MLMAKTIRSKDNLGSIDIAINKPDARQPPTGIYSAHIEDGNGIISEGVIGLWTTFTEVFRILDCSDICIEYDGTWVKNINGSYDFYTFGNPYILYTRMNKFGVSDLFVQQSNGVPIMLSSGHITSISLCRGWRSLIDEESNQGLIAAYVSNGKICYRSLVYKNDVLTWDVERVLDIGYNDVLTVNVARTNDYRVIFTGQLNNGEHYLAYSERCWVGFAVEPEVISRTSETGSISFTPISSKEGSVDSETVTRHSNVGDMLARTINHPTNIHCTNISDCEIKVIHNTDLVTSNVDDVILNTSILGTNGRKYNILKVEQFRNYTKLTTVRFNNELGTLRVTYNGKGGLTTILGDSINEFDVTFKPVDLVPDVVDPAKVTKIININNDMGV